MALKERWIAGVDGCRGGWIVVCLPLHPFTAVAHRLTVCASFDDILREFPYLAVLAIDMPIGLLETPQPGGRQCDREARRLLGRRASSIFTPPCRPWLNATTYAEVRPYGLSRQAFGILPKIREMDTRMTPALQQQVYEAHPELAFRSLAGQPLAHNKKTAAGQSQRLQLLHDLPEPPFRGLADIFPSLCQTFRRTQVAADDVLDAWVLAWVARRLATGHAQRVPATPPVDARGLRMEICF